MVRWTILSSSTVTPEGPLPSIPFGDVGPLHRLSSMLQPIRELCEMLLQMLPVAVPGARCRSLRTCVRDLATMPLFEGFTGTMGQSDFPRPFIAGIPSTGSLCGPSRHRPGPDAGPPGFRTRCLGCMHRVSDRAGARRHSRYRGAGCGLRSAPWSGSWLFAAQNWTYTSPVNASPLRLPATTHDSGLSWFATPSTQMTFTSYTSPV